LRIIKLARAEKAKIESFLKNRSAIERLARVKYLTWPVEEPEAVLIKTLDVPKLRKSRSIAG
jgi:hypothetical protein